MARLILTEGDQRRRFRLNPGTLTIGSGETATLTLASDEVAEVHAELEYDGEQLVLRTKKGVMPATSRGRKLGTEHTLEAGVPVKIGDAELVLETDESAAQPAKAPARAGAGTRRRKVVADAPAGKARQPVVESRRRTTSGKSMPTWLILLLVAGGAAGGYYVIGGFAESAGKRMVSEISVQHNVESALDERDFNTARAEFQRLDEAVSEGMVLSPEWQGIFDGLRKRTAEVAAAADLAEFNVRGTEYLQKQIRNFEKTYLRKNTRPAARVFVTRLRQFKKDFPQHSELDWCTRMEERYAPIAQLHEPDTFEDVKFQLRMLTGGIPKDFVHSREIVDIFLKTADEAGRDKVLALWDEKEGERQEYFDDRIEQAKYFWERDQRGKAVEVLVKLVALVGDPEMADDAAGRIAAMGEDVVPAMRGYKNDRPEDFALMMENGVMNAFLSEHGLLE
ncbi:MAG: hypothetical protein GY711_14950 [bacterium]|nr:hypothetical protein [bacterium]